MEDIDVKSLKSVARRGGAVSVAAASALLLAACSAGQITQTSSQVAAVNGASAQTEDGSVAVRDVTVLLDETGKAALKFTATNQDYDMREHTLQSVEVDGQSVQLGSVDPMPYNTTLVGDSADGLDTMPEADMDKIQYVETALDNDDFAYGGNLPVTFTFDSGTIETLATVSAPTVKSGESHRQPEAEH
ncbi:hypothetical protein [Corynebacterium appendicis]|uniref:hypothetical protein n=1 Tax=Corynebacterium appendicis TaxID=163202 RepID=UPI0009702313|nr:hypothetical protein [Corynebacterium appendicis]MCT1684867.1 hypothetical protein [Corynebacterium appendicis]